jgi:hypothetical protein
VGTTWSGPLERLGRVLDELESVLDELPPDCSKHQAEVDHALDFLLRIRFNTDKGARILEARSMRFGDRDEAVQAWTETGDND